MPRKLKKPATSVTVVRMIEEDCVGAVQDEFDTERPDLVKIDPGRYEATTPTPEVGA